MKRVELVDSEAGRHPTPHVKPLGAAGSARWACSAAAWGAGAAILDRRRGEHGSCLSTCWDSTKDPAAPGCLIRFLRTRRLRASPRCQGHTLTIVSRRRRTCRKPRGGSRREQVGARASRFGL
jgi:hypothetical protein